MFDKNIKLEINCPGCNKIFSKTIREIESQPEFICPHCGAPFKDNNFIKSLNDAEKNLKDSLDKIGGTFTINL